MCNYAAVVRSGWWLMPAIDPDVWLAGVRRRAQERQQADSAEFFADPTNQIPDLEFRCPDCPICGEETRSEDGQFNCEVCSVWWPSSGYGHEAERQL